MAYFSNGTEGGIYESRVCNSCLNYKLDEFSMGDIPGCPIWDLHHKYNYDQFPEHEKTPEAKKLAFVIRDILEHLIPDKTKKCAMYMPETRYMDKDNQNERSFDD